MFIRAFLFGLLAASPCFACPSSDDLSKGVEIVFSDKAGKDVRVLYKRAADGELTASQTSKDGGLSHIVSAQGILAIADFETDEEDKAKGSRREYAYDFELPIPPQPGQSYDGQQLEPKADDAPEPVSVEITVGETKAGQLGECAYALIPVETIYTDEGGQYIEQFEFAAELGFAVLTGYALPAIGITETYTPLTVKALP